MRDVIRQSLEEARTALDRLLANAETLDRIGTAAERLTACFEEGGRVFACGNGGSMCDAVHFAEELTGRFRRDRPGMAAVAISDPGHITCVANDFGYEEIFSRYLQSHGRAGDILLGLSTSGKSRNVLRALSVAQALGMTTIALTGQTSSPLAAAADIAICTPAGKFADRVQELHIKVIHILIELVERHRFPAKS
ncbi:MAG: SIS domain-containing protein [Desulfosarcinaceae bacterium]|nr:SIS domain-containing protein [Desulfosarcinaceae bacterium]